MATSTPAPGRIHYGRATGLLGLHLTILLTPWTCTREGLIAAVVLVLLTGLLGIGLGYHRLLCHRSFRTVPWLRYLLALLGVLAFQKGPLTWCAIHRLHHRHSDSEQDPQLSHRNLLWAHLLWTVARSPAELATAEQVHRVTRDLQRDPILRCMEHYFVAINAVFALGLFLLGWLLGGVALALSLVVWGFFVRILYLLHLTLLVNSVTHRWGYRNYPSPDSSRNCWWVALLSYGEGWHNNHHHRPHYAAHGHRWFELDVSYTVIRLLEWLGLACEVKRPDQTAKA